MRGKAKEFKPLLDECLDTNPAARPTNAAVCEKLQSIKDANGDEILPPDFTLYLQSIELTSESKLQKHRW